MDFCLLLKILGKISEVIVVKNLLDSAAYTDTVTKKSTADALKTGLKNSKIHCLFNR